MSPLAKTKFRIFSWLGDLNEEIIWNPKTVVHTRHVYTPKGNVQDRSFVYAMYPMYLRKAINDVGSYENGCLCDWLSVFLTVPSRNTICGQNHPANWWQNSVPLTCLSSTQGSRYPSINLTLRMKLYFLTLGSISRWIKAELRGSSEPPQQKPCHQGLFGVQLIGTGIYGQLPPSMQRVKPVNSTKLQNISTQCERTKHKNVIQTWS